MVDSNRLRFFCAHFDEDAAGLVNAAYGDADSRASKNSAGVAGRETVAETKSVKIWCCVFMKLALLPASSGI